jgi:hypothetical protein
MPHNHTNRPKMAAASAAVLVLLACLGLAACGGSSGSSSSTSASAAGTTTGSTGSTGARGANAGRFAALRECLQKNGITLPQRVPGQQRRPPGAAGGFLGGGGGAGRPSGAGGPPLPKGVTRAQYEAAVKKCGGSKFAGRGGGGARIKNPVFQAALAKFASCMRQNGVNVPAPNTSGSGPVFNTKGLDTTGAQFKAAEAKCQSDLSAAFRRGAGADGTGAGGGPAGGGPGGGGEATPAG